jgi:hypothetical protein
VKRDSIKKRVRSVANVGPAVTLHVDGKFAWGGPLLALIRDNRAVFTRGTRAELYAALRRGRALVIGGGRFRVALWR